MENKQRLDKLLSNFGYGTRKEIKKIIKNGIVKVDGDIVKDSSMHVDPTKSTIIIGNETLNYRQFVYVMLNKPKGVVSATFDNKYRTVIDILPDEFKCFDLFPVGRLDIDTEGLLLLTNDGQLAHNLLSPKKHISKIYYVLVEGELNESAIIEFEKGVIIDDGYRTLPAKLSILRKGNTSEAEITIFEGKFHQVKRMFEAVGNKVKYLKRIQMAELKLDESLGLGEYKELSSEDLNLLLKLGVQE